MLLLLVIICALSSLDVKLVRSVDDITICKKKRKRKGSRACDSLCGKIVGAENKINFSSSFPITPKIPDSVC